MSNGGQREADSVTLTGILPHGSRKGKVLPPTPGGITHISFKTPVGSTFTDMGPGHGWPQQPLASTHTLPPGALSPSETGWGHPTQQLKQSPAGRPHTRLCHSTGAISKTEYLKIMPECLPLCSPGPPLGPGHGHISPELQEPPNRPSCISTTSSAHNKKGG